MVAWRVAALLAAVSGCGRVDFGAVDAAIPDDAPGAVDSPDTLASDLIVHLTFDDGADLFHDSARDHAVSCSGCPIVSASDNPAVPMGMVARFAGTQALRISDTGDLMPSVFTVAMWGKAMPSQNLISRPYQGATTLQNTFELYTTNMDELSAHMGPISINAGMANNTWHHVAATYDGAQLTLFLDGTVQSSGPAPLVYDAADEWIIGADIDIGALNNQLNGAVDDVRIYSRVLSPSEISVLAN